MTQPQDDQHQPDAAAEDNVVELQGAEVDAAPAAGDRTAELEKKLAESNDRLLRALAEADNTRKRLEKERQDTSKYAISSFARELLSVSDNLRRALNAITPDKLEANAELKTIFTGVEATERVLLQLFEKHGIKKIDPQGQMFDPNLHEVIFEAELPGQPAGHIVQVIEPGYTIHDRLLRPARVGVAKGDAVHHVDTSA